MSGELHIAALNATTPPQRLRELFEQRPSLGRLLAQNPASPSDLLEKLVEHPDPEVHELVVLNPNTPAALLFSLGQRFPKQLMKNPMFPLLLLESPNLYAEMPEQTLAGLLAQDGTPEPLLEWASGHKSDFIRLAVAHNQAASGGLLRRLSFDREPSIRRAVSAHPKTPLEVLARLSNDASQEIRQLIARNPRTPPYALAILLGDTSPEVRKYTLHNASTPSLMIQSMQRAGASDDFMRLYGPPDLAISEDALLYLSRGGPKARELAARHPNVTEALLSLLGKDDSPEVRRAVAQHPRASAALLAKLASDPDHDVRWFVARNPGTSQDTLRRLSSEERIAWSVASNPQTPPEFLRELSSHRGEFLRECLRQNPNTPEDVRQKLSDEA
jgi:hypothetical protein